MEEAEVLALAREHGLLATLEPAVLEKVVRASKIVHLRPDRPLVKSGDPPDYLYCLLRGTVRVFYKDDAGGEVLIKLFRAPAILCEMEVLTQVPVLPNARTLSDSDVLYVPAEIFRQLVRTEPKLAQVLVFDLARRLCVSRDQARSLAFADTERRISNLLLDYAQLFGIKTDDGVRIEVSLSQDDMARDLGVSRKAVNLVLSKLKDDNVVDKRDARYVILDVPALSARSTQSLGLMHRLGAEISELQRPKEAS
ncbi:MAG: Crp/Fnr family transcriptional regulator [Deltaproteobacteria bacterium]|nr:Crp/Fnr family transcriptional regulator [Deltaproteobacteria bacterium]